MSGTLQYTTYDGGLGREQIVRIGDGDGPRLLIVPPLFDEHNKMRRTLVMAMRGLAARGIDSALPDITGQNESIVPLTSCQYSDWKSAISRAASAVQATHVAAIRSACLLDAGLSHLLRWRHLPLAGDRIVTHLIRTQLASDKAAGRASSRQDFEGQDEGATLHLSGFTLNGAMVTALQGATPAPLENPHDRLVEGSLGPALWLRAEPSESAEFSATLAMHWAEWMAG